MQYPVSGSEINIKCILMECKNCGLKNLSNCLEKITHCIDCTQKNVDCIDDKHTVQVKQFKGLNMTTRVRRRQKLHWQINRLN